MVGVRSLRPSCQHADGGRALSTKTRVIITRHDDIEKAVSDAFALLDVRSLVADKIVAVKPNETAASAEDKTGVTQPDTLRAVLRGLKPGSPRHVVVSGGSGAGETEEVFRVAGLSNVVKSEGVEFFDHNHPPFVSVGLEYAPDKDVAGPQEAVVVNRRVLGYESLVVVSQLKVHSLATVTLSLKNVAMSYPAADHYGYPRAKEERKHHFFEDIHSFIAAMAKRFPIALAVTVGHPAMIGTGPLGGHTVETGIVIASTDALAADVVGARLLGFRPEAVAHLWEAGRLGLGETDVSEMEFPALSLEEAAAAFTEAAYGHPLSLEA